jgi:hypothetical protein
MKTGKRVMVFEIGVLRKTFWPEREKVTGELAELHIAKGHNLHCLPGITQISNDGI